MLRRQHDERYLAKGKSGGRIPLTRPEQLTDREREKIVKRSYELGEVAVLDPHEPVVGHFALVGPFAVDAAEVVREHGTSAFKTTICKAYRIAFVVESGQWVDVDEYFRARDWEDTPLMHTLDPARHRDAADDWLGL